MRISVPIVLAATTVVASSAAAPTAKSKIAAAPFGAKLHAQLASRTGNLIYSPSSVAIALAMTREGAAGATARELDAVLGPTARADAKALTKAFAGKPAAGPPEIVIANRLFGDAPGFERAFLDVTRADYGAALEPVDFRGHGEAGRTTINRWVELQTKNKIKDLIAPGALDAQTRLVLVNAIYLKAAWATPFERSNTKPAAFTIDAAGNQTTRQVATMHGRVGSRWGAHAGARMVDLPYVGSDLRMLIVVPDHAKLATIEADYANQGLAPYLAAADANAGVTILSLPKFKVGGEFELGPALETMGMKTAFSPGAADFRGISTREKLFLSRAIHKAWIEIDENGTEAAAATAIGVEPSSVPQTQVFAVDRSFLFFIHDRAGNVVFGGRVIDPS